MGKKEKSTGYVSIIGGSDGPTSIFLAGNKKKTFRQKLQKQLFQLRKRWYALWIKPEAHTMDEVIRYAKGKYGFEELSPDTKEYSIEHDSMRAAYILQYKPELLGEYAEYPQLRSHDEEGIREFQHQMELREQKAREIPKEAFPFDFHMLRKKENENEMHLSTEAVYGYIGGGFSGPGRGGKRRFQRIYKDIYKYYGVTKADIINQTERYENLLRTLAMKG